MPTIKAVFLAAGRGVRMGERGRMTPKGLISLGPQSFLEDAIDTLAMHGITDIRVVTGHLAEHYRELAAGRRPSLDLRHNDNFTTKGSLQSLMVGLDGLDGPCLVLESDLVFEPRAVAAAIAEPQTPALLTSGKTGAGDEVHVWIDDREGRPCLRDMSKLVDRWHDAPYGELVGLTYLTGEAVARMQEIGPQMIALDPMADYESGVVELAQSQPVIVPRIDDLAWAEVDNEAMLARAAEQVYPRIEAARRKG
ncbi:phosphocholine cytidylyltransferase family protein [Stappia sp. 28M-7]|uniref:phosphocholine cytidylyltransferase family protein n=1 Tax=Stappia sp. 28M-7 TaxID=2762596 RepID=UPI00163C9807|nr:phosphocholine cytidylyltransferase family protein [Stappia sp. 28M-7]MBC2860993.1 phosphocholine cytidylyltransferase family protein [Stappia sp. 28M-7]